MNRSWAAGAGLTVAVLLASACDVDHPFTVAKMSNQVRPAPAAEEPYQAPPAGTATEAPTMSESPGAPGIPVPTGPATLNIAESQFGSILVGVDNRTLYLFEKDMDGTSACLNECALAWPPFLTEGEPTAGQGVDQKLLGTITRPDGKKQVTYNDHPLYYYIADKQSGDVLGQGLEAFGAKWFVVNSHGDKVEE
ncbi:COG4315 family predicted lipoprotein [Rhizohabitans arisaemae]|uniref:COG4315 family predicted lipoprotein n=1 Tax=Rhizohabitans arisaemae TaxID=2720610 RepID=UPI0024B04FC6|nr:hypothetical protein [Rhizohabitans arisaemae]